MSDEEHDTLRTALISSISGLHPNPQTKVVVRVDNAPGFQALKNDNHLQQLYIELDFGRIKNENKNPVAEKAVREVAIEILRYDPEAGPMTVDSLALITSQLNPHIRNPGLSAWEILHQRDQESGHRLPFIDQELSKLQSEKRKTNQTASAKHKAQGGPPARPADIQLGLLSI